jgi:2-phosphosulfolactate phosphatase
MPWLRPFLKTSRMKNITVCYLPSQWRALEAAQLRDSACVVIDVIRATTTIAAALASGATGIRPVASLAEAEALKAERPDRLLAGERHGIALPGFDLGNSPRAMTRARVGGRELILTTTNGTQALAACAGARAVVTCGLANLAATAAKLRELGAPWIFLCAGFEGDFGMDDAVAAGALTEALGEPDAFTALYRSVRADVAGAFLGSLAGRELTKIGLQDDVPFCAERDSLAAAPVLGADGVLRAG